MRVLVVLTLIMTFSAVSAEPSAPANGERAYVDWVVELAKNVGSSHDPGKLAMLAALRQHACAGRSDDCFPAAQWRAMKMEAGRGARPALLALLANVAAERKEDDIAQWERVAAEDPKNAYPVILIAAARWKEGDHLRALELLREATQVDRMDDYFSSIVGYVKAAVQGHAPTVEQLYPCARESLPHHASHVEIENAVIFHIAVDIGISPHVGDLSKLCHQDEGPWDATRAGLCGHAGEQLRTATSLLNRSFGIALQKFSTRDEAVRSRLTDEQQAQSDKLHGALWWTDEGRNDKIRQSAAEFWMEQLVRNGEVAAGDALIQRFGPTPETPAQRDARVNAFLARAQRCYSRTN